MSADYGTLDFSNVDFTSLEKGVSPHFQCPICKYQWQPIMKLGENFPETFDFNQKVRFVIPEHTDVRTASQCLAVGKTIDLFVAVHSDSNGASICIQRSDLEGAAGIPVLWWRTRV